VVGGKTTRRREVVGQVVSETWELGLKRGARWGPESGGKQKVFARIWASFTSQKIFKIFHIPRHIKSLDAYMKY